MNEERDVLDELVFEGELDWQEHIPEERIIEFCARHPEHAKAIREFSDLFNTDPEGVDA